MSAVYFMGAKCITSKKSGKIFYPANFLTKNNWGDWQIVTKFCDNADVFSDVNEIPVGSPVVCTFGMNGELLKCIDHDSVPVLDLDNSDI